MRRPYLPFLAAALLAAPTAALGFETIDALPFPSSGRFPA
jgi:hypothetical protein